MLEIDIEKDYLDCCGVIVNKFLTLYNCLNYDESELLISLVLTSIKNPLIKKDLLNIIDSLKDDSLTTNPIDTTYIASTYCGVTTNPIDTTYIASTYCGVTTNPIDTTYIASTYCGVTTN